jgi:hypothetical protein
LNRTFDIISGSYCTTFLIALNVAAGTILRISNGWISSINFHNFYHFFL